MAKMHVARHVVLEVSETELRALRRGLEHDLGGALEGVRYSLHHDLERFEEQLAGKVDVPGYQQGCSVCGDDYHRAGCPTLRGLG